MVTASQPTLAFALSRCELPRTELLPQTAKVSTTCNHQGSQEGGGGSRRARSQPALGHILTPARYQLLPATTTAAAMAKNVREYCSDTRKLSYFLASLAVLP